jgi:hypothetical protein
MGLFKTGYFDQKIKTQLNANRTSAAISLIANTNTLLFGTNREENRLKLWLSNRGVTPVWVELGLGSTGNYGLTVLPNGGLLDLSGWTGQVAAWSPGAANSAFFLNCVYSESTLELS